jgi:hypothetical protein
MGQSKKEYQEWVEHHFPQEVVKEINNAWTQQFEQFIQQLMNTKFKESDDEQNI